MDQELIAYLDQHFRGIDERFRETWRQISDLREETTRQFERIDARFEQIDARFEQVDSRFAQVDARFERVEETARHTLVLVEGLRDEVRLIAEGMLGLSESVERYREDSTLTIAQVKGWIEPYYKSLDGRIRILEGWAERQNWDVLEAVRRLLGKFPQQRPVASD